MNDQEKHSALARQREDKSETVVMRMLGAAAKTAGALAFPTPHSTVDAAGGWVKFAQAYKEAKLDYQRFLESRNQIARHVLDLYKLAQAEDGDYILKRGYWDLTRQYDSNSTVSARGIVQYNNLPELCDIGIDSQLDKSKLPILPNIERDGPG